MVKDLGVRLLMGSQDMHKGGRWVGSNCGRIDGPPHFLGLKEAAGVPE